MVSATIDHISRSQRATIMLLSIILIPTLIVVGFVTFGRYVRDETATCPPICHEANFDQADLAGANLQGSDFYFANIQDANLHGVCMVRVNLQPRSDRQLTGANLKEVNLQGVNLQNANLTSANLQQTDYPRISTG